MHDKVLIMSVLLLRAHESGGKPWWVAGNVHILSRCQLHGHVLKGFPVLPLCRLASLAYGVALACPLPLYVWPSTPISPRRPKQAVTVEAQVAYRLAGDVGGVARWRSIPTDGRL